MALDLAAAYDEARRSLTDLVRELGPDELAMKVPASPAWDVKDVVAHLAALAQLASHGTAPPELDLPRSWSDAEQAGIREAMNQREVEARRGRSLEEILDEWAGHTKVLLPMMRGDVEWPMPIPFLANVVTTDLAMHVQDVRNAVGRPGERESAAVGAALASYTGGLDLRLRMHGLRALRIRYGDRERVLGDGEPAATLTADRYEILRALSGRRSSAQIRAMQWEGDPEPYLEHLPAYGERADDLEE